MPVKTETHRVFIASSRDLTSERDLVEQVLSKWNRENSSRENIVFLPLRYERHTFANALEDAQNAINEQVLRHADLGIAMFWKRAGFPTAGAPCGTKAELEYLRMLGRDVIVAFCERPIPIHEVEASLEDLRTIRDIEGEYTNRLTIRFDNDHQLTVAIERQLHNYLAKIRHDASQELSRSEADDSTSNYDGAVDESRLSYQATVNEPGDLRVLKPTIEKLEAQFGPNLRILDFGCSSGHLGRSRFAEYPQIAEVVGVDVDEDAVDRARTAVDGKSKFRYVHGDIMKADLDLGGKFHLIFAAQVLHHLADPALVLQELYKFLEPGGKIFARSSDDGLDLTFPRTHESVGLLESSRRLGGMSNRLYGREIYSDLRALSPQPDVDIDFHVLSATGKTDEERGKYFEENHGFRAGYGSRLRQSYGDRTPPKEQTDIARHLRESTLKEHTRYVEEDLFAISIQILALATKPA